MPLLSSPRRLTTGLYCYGCTKFEGRWRKFNMRTTDKKAAAEKGR